MSHPFGMALSARETWNVWKIVPTVKMAGRYRSIPIHSNCFGADIPYFFGYKTKFFSFQNKPKDLDPSCKMDLDLWDCLGRVKLVLLQNFIGLI